MWLCRALWLGGCLCPCRRSLSSHRMRASASLASVGDVETLQVHNIYLFQVFACCRLSVILPHPLNYLFPLRRNHLFQALLPSTWNANLGKFPKALSKWTSNLIPRRLILYSCPPPTHQSVHLWTHFLLLCLHYPLFIPLNGCLYPFTMTHQFYLKKPFQI